MLDLYNPAHGVTFTHDGFESMDLYRHRFNFNIKQRIKTYRHSKVLLLRRDPKDVLVSLYFQQTKRDPFFSGTISEFIRSHQGIRTLENFYLMWKKILPEIKNHRILNYEEFSQYAFEHILFFFGFKINPKRIQKCMQMGTFANMKKLEQSDKHHAPWLRPRNKDDNDTYKCRRGIIGGYKDYLNKKDIKFINNIIGKNKVLERYT
jgi:hypothetical protein